LPFDYQEFQNEGLETQHIQMRERERERERERKKERKELFTFFICCPPSKSSSAR
jgi:hypothetical protein